MGVSEGGGGGGDVEGVGVSEGGGDVEGVGVSEGGGDVEGVGVSEGGGDEGGGEGGIVIVNDCVPITTSDTYGVYACASTEYTPAPSVLAAKLKFQPESDGALTPYATGISGLLPPIDATDIGLPPYPATNICIALVSE